MLLFPIFLNDDGMVTVPISLKIPFTFLHSDHQSITASSYDDILFPCRIRLSILITLIPIPFSICRPFSHMSIDMRSDVLISTIIQENDFLYVQKLPAYSDTTPCFMVPSAFALRCSLRSLRAFLSSSFGSVLSPLT